MNDPPCKVVVNSQPPSYLAFRKHLHLFITLPFEPFSSVTSGTQFYSGFFPPHCFLIFFFPLVLCSSLSRPFNFCNPPYLLFIVNYLFILSSPVVLNIIYMLMKSKLYIQYKYLQEITEQLSRSLHVDIFQISPNRI